MAEPDQTQDEKRCNCHEQFRKHSLESDRDPCPIHSTQPASKVTKVRPLRSENVSDRTFTLPEVAEDIGIEYRTAHKWLLRGIITATVKQSDGAGYPGIFSEADLKRARLAADLRRAGIEVQKLEHIAPTLDEQEWWESVIQALGHEPTPHPEEAA